MNRNGFGFTAAAIALLAVLALVVGSASGGASVARTTASPPVNASLPAISGTARQGETLAASAGAWGGVTPITFAYSWQRCDAQGSNCSALSGATGQTYALTASDVGHTIRVAVTASNGDGSAQVLSEQTGTIAAPGEAPANTRQPDPSGTAQEGQTIHVDEGSWSGTPPITFRYQWQRCTAQNALCTAIAGATSRSYRLTAAEVGWKLRAEVIASNHVGQGSVFSNLTELVIARGAVPQNTALPVISGEATVGHTLSASSGSWTGASGAFSYQWRRGNSGGNNWTDIAGAHGQTYTLVSADAGGTVRVVVTASNPAGSASAESTALSIASVTPSDLIDLGGGMKSVPVGSLIARPDRLLISQIEFSPQPFGIRNGTFTARFRVLAEGTNNVVRGALVNVVGIPYGWISQPGELTTGTDGWVSFQIHTTGQMQLRNGGALVMQVRARASGNTTSELLGGISTRRLVQLNLTAPK